VREACRRLVQAGGSVYEGGVPELPAQGGAPPPHRRRSAPSAPNHTRGGLGGGRRRALAKACSCRRGWGCRRTAQRTRCAARAERVAAVRCVLNATTTHAQLTPAHSLRANSDYLGGALHPAACRLAFRCAPLRTLCGSWCAHTFCSRAGPGRCPHLPAPRHRRGDLREQHPARRPRAGRAAEHPPLDVVVH
jgi:hypothetical protein